MNKNGELNSQPKLRSTVTTSHVDSDDEKRTFSDFSEHKHGSMTNKAGKRWKTSQTYLSLDAGRPSNVFSAKRTMLFRWENVGK